MVVPACVTVKAEPAMVSVPVRVDVPVFAATVKPAVPDPTTLAPDVTEIHEALLTEVHAHPAATVTVDAFEDPDDIGLWCEVAGERMQEARTSRLIFSIPVLVAYLSSICTLYPGDVIFTGTPSGVGMARGRYLAVGEVVVSGAEVIGELRNVCVPGVGPLAT